MYTPPSFCCLREDVLWQRNIEVPHNLQEAELNYAWQYLIDHINPQEYGGDVSTAAMKALANRALVSRCTEKQLAQFIGVLSPFMNSSDGGNAPLSVRRLRETAVRQFAKLTLYSRVNLPLCVTMIDKFIAAIKKDEFWRRDETEALGILGTVQGIPADSRSKIFTLLDSLKQHINSHVRTYTVGPYAILESSTANRKETVYKHLGWMHDYSYYPTPIEISQEFNTAIGEKDITSLCIYALSLSKIEDMISCRAFIHRQAAPSRVIKDFLKEHIPSSDLANLVIDYAYEENEIPTSSFLPHI